MAAIDDTLITDIYISRHFRRIDDTTNDDKKQEIKLTLKMINM